MRLTESAFADAWRAEYQPGMEEVRAGRIPFCKLDILHMHNLEQILPRFGVGAIDAVVKNNLNMAWHRLDAWPDVSAGLHTLKRKFMIAPVSNGNISLMVALARRNGFPWDAILGSEIAGDFKPKPRVYLSACEALDLAPAQCMMAAAHPNDLVAAAACGLKTAYVSRPHEKGRASEYRTPTEKFDITASNVEQLATKLGA